MSGQQGKLLALGVLVIAGGGLWVGTGRKETWHGEGQGAVCREQEAFGERWHGGRKQEEGEVAVATSPSYK